MKKVNYDDNNFLDVIDESKSYEDNIAAVWKRNVFFILGYGFTYVYFFIVAIFNRLFRLPKWIKCKFKKEQYVYVRKVSKHKWIKMHNIIVDSNIWRTMWFMIFFLSIGFGKLFYHIFNIIVWLCKYVLVPVVKWLTAVFAILSISSAISNRNNPKY